MRDLDSLQQQALSDSLAFAQRHLTGDFHAEPVPMSREQALSWDPVELRYVADQTVVLWRRYGEFEVVLDEDSRVVGYVDHDKWEKCRWVPLSEDESLAIARTSGLLRPGLKLAGAGQGERGCLELRLEASRQDPAPGLVVRINPARRAVISVLPAEEESR